MGCRDDLNILNFILKKKKTLDVKGKTLKIL